MSEPNNELLPTRASLLGRLRDWQNTASWQEFFDTYWKLIYGVARKSSLSDCEAQDVVQEVLVHVARQMPAFQYDPAIGSFKGWLLTKTRWCIIEQLRQRAHGDFPGSGSTDVEDPLQQIADVSGPSLDEVWEKDWQKQLFEAALLRVKQRGDGLNLQLFEFYVRKELPVEQVAAKFMVSVNQVYLAKHRVTGALKEEIERLEREIT